MPAWELVGGEGGCQVTAPSTMYFQCKSQPFEQTVEAAAQMKVYASYRASKLYIRVVSNTLTAAAPLTFRKNSGPTALTLSVPAGGTGAFMDNTHRVSLVSGDLIDLQWVASGTATKVAAAAMVSYALRSVGAPYPIPGGQNTGGLSATYYFPICGSGGTGTLAKAQHTIRTAQNVTNLSIEVSANTRDGDCTWALWVNGAQSALVVTIGSTLTGLFEDTSHSVALAAGDLINNRLVVGGSAGSVTFNTYTHQGDSIWMLQGATWGAGLADSVADGYDHLDAWLSGTGGGMVPLPVRLKEVKHRNLFANVSANTTTGNHTLAIEVNGSDSALILTVPAGTTGKFENTADTITLATGDTRYFHRHRVSGAGTITWTILGVEQTGTDFDEVNPPSGSIAHRMVAAGLL